MQEEMDCSQEDENQHGNDNAEIENDKQLEDLARMKQSGFNRVGPQFQSVEKSQMIKCTQCDLEFDSELNLKKHDNAKHNKSNNNTRLIKCVSCNVELNSQVDLMSHMESHQGVNQTIPVVESSRHLQRPNIDSIGSRRQYNCHSCSQQYENVRYLQKHARVTGHKTDDLSQHCYICNKRCANFDDLMKHRKMSHPHDINACRFYADTGYCKFETAPGVIPANCSGSDPRKLLQE